MNGHCHIHGIVQLQRQPSTKKKKDDDFVQLEFSYERTPTPKNGTNIVYTIWKSYNYGPKDIFINIEVIATGDTPSTEEAIPMFQTNDNEDQVWEDVIVSDEDDNSETMEELSSTSPMTRRNESTTELEDGKDYYSAFVNPSILTDWYTTWKSNLDDAATLYLLMTFPFYEHEWDIVGYLMDTVFDQMDDDDETDDNNNSL